MQYKWRRGLAVLILGLLCTPLSIPIETGMIAPVYAQTVPKEVATGYSLLGKGWMKEAIAAFEKAVQRYPQSLEAKIGLAIAYRRQGDIDKAWGAYQQALNMDGNNQLVLKTIGLIAGYRPQWQIKGIEALTTLLNISPNDTEARAQRALLYGYQGRFPESLSDYKIVLQTSNVPDVLLGAAQVYTYSGNYQQGIELFNRYRATGRAINEYAAIAYGRALRETGNPRAAVDILETELRRSNVLDNKAIQARAELAQAYIANQQSTQALAILDPLRGRPDAILPLARSLNEIGRRANQPSLSAEAATLYRQALAQTPNPSPILLREVADVLSGVPSQKTFAVQLYRQLTAQTPDDKGLLVQASALESQLGLISQTELKQRLRTALQPLPSSAVQQQLLAQALVRIDTPEPEFLSAYQTLASNVNQPFLNFRIAQILIQRNDLIAARRSLETYTNTQAGSNDQAPELIFAEIERREGNLAASAKRYQTLIASNQSSGNGTDKDILNAALRGLAGIRLSQSRPQDALTLYDKLIALNPQDLTLQLGRTSIAYQTKSISQAQAEAMLNNWLVTNSANDAPPELFSLVGALPPNPQRESLYNNLLEVDPNNIPIQLRLVQIIASRNPAQARARVNRIIARDPNNVGAYFLQAQLAQAIGDLELASRAYNKVLVDQPENTDALSALGGIRFQQRQFDSAQEFYNQVLAIKPEDRVVRRSLADLSVAQDRPLAALQQIEQLQVEQFNDGGSNVDLVQQRQKIQEDFLRRRGFQPPWERY